MNAFRFGLQKVLELREQEEQDHARVLADAEARAAAARRQLAELSQIHDEEAAKLMRAHSEGRAVGQLRNLQAVIQHIAQQVDLATRAMHDAAQSVEQCRAELTTAMIQRRVLDQLRDRKLVSWRQDVLSEERKQMDELAMSRFQRRPSDRAREAS